MSRFRDLDVKTRRAIYQQEAKKSYSLNKIGIIIETHSKSQIKYNRSIRLMVSNYFRVLSLMQTARTKLKNAELFANQSNYAIFLFCNGKILKSGDLISELVKYKNEEDGFIYLQVAETETF